MWTVGNWPLDPAVTAGLLLAGALFVGADRRLRRQRGQHGAYRSRRRLFLAGLIAIFVALESPIDAGADTSLSVHMVQHLLLTMVAAPLLVAAAPMTLALRAWPGRLRRWGRSILRSAFARRLSNPLVAWSAFVGAMWGYHVTGLFDAALRSEGLHVAEHLVFLMSALLFWMPVVGADPTPSRISHAARILYLFLSMPAMAFLGLTIYSANHVLYPTYAIVEGTARAFADQQQAGAIMWESGMFVIVLALAYVLLDWMRFDDREARRADERRFGRTPAEITEGGGLSGPSSLTALHNGDRQGSRP